jgi:glycosyltransferase involved in cell wall biosynthesis
MKIALVVLTRGGVSGGFRKYLQRLVPLLREQPDVSRVDVFVPPQMAGPGDRTWPVRDELWGYRELRRSIAALGPDVVFVPTARMLRVGSIPVVTMVRNMEPLEVPFEGNGPVEMLKNIGRSRAAKRAARRSDRVIAVSRHVRDFLVDRWRIPEARIGVVPHGIDAGDVPATPPPSVASLAEGPFLFTAGSIRPARGLEDVIDALARIPEQYKLVIAGNVDRGAEHYDHAIRELARERGVASRVIWIGQLDADAMAWCFRNAALFVMTSRAEACPNIVLEAMAAGAASISTDHPPMPEFFGDAATYYRARDAAHLAQRLSDALAAPEGLRRQQRECGTIRAAALTWEATAQATVSELRRAIE